MRLGIFGGSFDPVHYGHLLLAERCREDCRLDCVWFLPAAVSPHKQGEPPTTAEARVQMLRLATSGHEAFEVSTFEIDRGGVSYTVDTLEAIQQQDPGRELFFLMGADSLEAFGSWREPARICQLAQVVFVARPGAEPVYQRLVAALGTDVVERIRAHQVTLPQVDFSSTDIRRRVAAGQSIRYLTPRSVEKYIEAEGLYRQA